MVWLHEHNRTIERREHRVGFYGLDLYSLHASMRAVVDYLERESPEAARAARASYACFEEFGHDTDTYAWAASRFGGSTCEEAVVRQLMELRQRRGELLAHDGSEASDEFFQAEQNARLAQNAERYYRRMFRGRVASWNVRDEHMAETLEELLKHLSARGQNPKVVVWAHNSHLGDARATEMGEGGELNLGQLVRQRHGAEARLIGFTTYAGEVIAASDWGAKPERKRVRPALEDSYEELFHETGRGNFFSAAACRDGSNGGAEPAATRACDRSDLPAGNRAVEPLFSGAASCSVRRNHPCRSNDRGRTAGAECSVADGRGG